MEAKSLTAEIREARKKGAARKLRRQGRIPAVVYGHEESIPVSIDAQEFTREFKHISESTIITLEAGEKTFDVLIKDYQVDVLKNRVLHLDFFEITAGQSLTTHVPVHVHGSPVGEREGGILEHPLYEVEIECLPKNIPEDLKVDVSNLGIGDSIHVSDIAVPEGVKILTSEDQIVALVSAPQAAEEPAEGEEEEGAQAGGEASEAVDEEQSED
ncbi:MAG: 50S ribosomal protein L25/general stress protein Ctc [Spirochaetales bacterium]